MNRQHLANHREPSGGGYAGAKCRNTDHEVDADQGERGRAFGEEHDRDAGEEIGHALHYPADKHDEWQFAFQALGMIRGEELRQIKADTEDRRHEADRYLGIG